MNPFNAQNKIQTSLNSFQHSIQSCCWGIPCLWTVAKLYCFKLTKIISDFRTTQSLGFWTSYTFCLMDSLPHLLSLILTYLMWQLKSLSLRSLPDNQKFELHFFPFPQHKICYFYNFYNITLAFSVFWHYILECKIDKDRILLRLEVVEQLCPTQWLLATCGYWEIVMWLIQIKWCYNCKYTSDLEGFTF